MPKKVREWGRWPVPNDWNEEEDGYMCYTICVPNSRSWRGIFTAHVDDISYGRNYNRETGIITEAQAIARGIFESMCAIKCDDIFAALECICESTTKVAEQGEQTGQTISDPPSDGVIEVGEGEQFPTSASYFDAKCNVANGIFDTLDGFMEWLIGNSVSMIAGLFGGVTSGLLVGFGLAGPVGWAYALVATLVAGLAGFVVAYSLNFPDVRSALADTHEECVKALYGASDTETAKGAFIAALEASSVILTPLEVQFVELLMTSEVLNQLFDPREDVALYQSPSPIVCGSVLAVWTFPTDFESWTFLDDSTANASASRSHDSGAEAIDTNLIVIAGGSFRTAIGINISPVIGIPVAPTNNVQWDFGSSSDGLIVGHTLKVTYADLTEEESSVTTKSAGTLIHNLTKTQNLIGIELSLIRSNGPGTTGYDLNVLTFEVRVS